MENFYRDVMRLHDEEFIKKIASVSYFVNVKKGETVIRFGEQLTRLYFLADGGIRCWYNDEKGRDITDIFMSEAGDAVMPMLFEKPSCCNFTAYKPTRLVALPLAESMALIQSNSEARGRYEDILRLAALRHLELKSHLYGSAAQRYEWFCSAYPKVVGEVSDKNIASLLGITPVSLSRLRHDRKAAREDGPAAESAAQEIMSAAIDEMSPSRKKKDNN